MLLAAIHSESIYLYLFVLLGDGMIQEEELEEVLRACLQVYQFLLKTCINLNGEQ